MPTVVGGRRRIKGGGRDVAACVASRIESLEIDEGGGYAGVGGGVRKGEMTGIRCRAN